MLLPFDAHSTLELSKVSQKLKIRTIGKKHEQKNKIKLEIS